MDALLPTPNLGLAVAINPRVDELAPMPLSRGGKIAIIVGPVLVIGAVVILWSWPRAVDSYGLEIQAAGAYLLS